MSILQVSFFDTIIERTMNTNTFSGVSLKLLNLQGAPNEFSEF